MNTTTTMQHERS